MPNEFNDGQEDELQSLPPEIRAAFQNYPRPRAGAEFDARFWRELDARRYRYNGLAGFWRRLIEIEIEGIAVWRLGVSTFAGASLCALGFTVLSWAIIPKTVVAPAPPVSVALSPDAPLSAPRFARGLWDDPLPRPPAPPSYNPRPSTPSLPASSRRQSASQETSCASFALTLA